MTPLPTTRRAVKGSFVLSCAREGRNKITNALWKGVLLTGVTGSAARKAAKVYFPSDGARVNMPPSAFAVIISGVNTVVTLPPDAVDEADVEADAESEYSQ
jgi:hypothetical protein